MGCAKNVPLKIRRPEKAFYLRWRRTFLKVKRNITIFYNSYFDEEKKLIAVHSLLEGLPREKKCATNFGQYENKSIVIKNNWNKNLMIRETWKNVWNKSFLSDWLFFRHHFKLLKMTPITKETFLFQTFFQVSLIIRFLFHLFFYYYWFVFMIWLSEVGMVAHFFPLISLSNNEWQM